MDEWDNLVIRFYFGGSFVTTGGQLKYVGGESALSSIGFDKLSLPEIKGHIRDHFNTSAILRLHWLQPGKQLSEGLMLLIDDGSCQLMAKHFTDGHVADIYVEDVDVEMYETEHEAEKMASDEDVGEVQGGYMSNREDNSDGENEEKDLESETSDEEYQQPPEEDSSGDDEEAQRLKDFAKEIKRNMKAQKLGIHGGQLGEITTEYLVDEVPNLDDPGSPYYDSSEDYSYEDNSDGETERWKSQENRYDSKAATPVFSLGMAFRCSRQFKKAVVKYGLRTHRHIIFVKDEQKKVRAVCSWKGCNWLIYGSITSRSEWFKVVTYVDEHTRLPRRDNKLVTSNRIAKYYYNQIKDNPTWKVELIKNAVLKDFLVDVSISKCKRAKSLVLKAALDSMKGEYTRVYDYQAELLRSNPSSTVMVCMNPEFEQRNVFERFYVCFDACKKGFLAGCRRVIGVDGCWFKGSNNGNLLCGIGRDANNQMYPIAWAAVATETYDSWYWFLGLLQKDLNICNGGEGWVVISDQQKGLLKAVAELIPNAEHRMCARHIYANWRKKHTDKELQKKWWACAKSPCRVLFNYNRAILAQDTPEGAADMLRTSPEHWSRAFFKLGSNCDSVDNNMCESFNNSIMDARFFPVISMHEAIRKKIMVRIQENRSRAEKWTGGICPNIFKKLKINIIRSGKCVVLWNGKDGFEVQEKEDRRYIVNLEQRTCTCRYWQLSGLPCCHAISCIYKSSRLLDDFIAPCFNQSEYMKTYAHVLQPVEGPINWPISDMPRPEPPAFVKMLGRPKTQRRREQGEAPKGTKLSKVGTKIRCRLCRKNDHNARRCPRNPEAGNKKNAHIKRDARRQKKKQDGPSTSRGTKRKCTEPMTYVATQQSQVASSTQGTNHGSTTQQPSQRATRGIRHLLFGDNY